MREVISSGFTPQRKIIGVNKNYGNSGIKRQQGSTVILYDTLDITIDSTYRFFEGANNRDFPLTNVGASGNKLPVGSSMVVERAYLTVFTKDAETGTLLKPEPIGVAWDGSQASEFGMQIANKEVIKHIPILSWDGDFNKNSTFENYSNFEFDTQVVLMPLLEYICTVRVQTGTVLPENGVLRLTLEGTGSIISPSTPF